MKPRYVIRARRPRMGYEDFAEWSSDEIRHGSIEVHEPKDEGPQETGLFDHLGNELMRLPDGRRPIGFLHVYEES